MKQKKKKKAVCINPYGFNEIAKGYDIRAKFLPEKRYPTKRQETGRVLIVSGPFVVHFRSSHCSCYSEEPATRATSNPSDVPATRKLEIQCLFPPLVSWLLLSLSKRYIYIYIYHHLRYFRSESGNTKCFWISYFHRLFHRRILPIFLESGGAKVFIGERAKFFGEGKFFKSL